MRKQSPFWVAASVVVSTVAMAQDKPPIVSLPEADAPDASSASQSETTGQAPKFEDRSREKTVGLFVAASPFLNGLRLQLVQLPASTDFRSPIQREVAEMLLARADEVIE
jgi:hypothetical protein